MLNKKLITLALITSFSPVFGQVIDTEELEKTVVLSDLREDKPVQETSNSIAVLDEDVLEKAGTQHFEDVMGLVPNLNWSSGSNRPRYFQIRGIGERSQYEGAPNPSVGFIVDDIDFSALGGVATLFDVEQVEVLRGPQGTRYGANGLAGLIYVKTKNPEFEPSYKVQATIGDDGDLGLGFRATGSINQQNTAAFRLSIQKYSADGFRYNDFLDRDDVNERDEFVARGKLFFKPNDQLDINLTLIKADINNGFDSFAPENGFTVHSDKPGRDEQDSTGFAVKANWQSQAFDFTSISSYMKADIDYSFDGDWGNDDYWGEFAPYDFTSENLRSRRHLSQEVRWASNEGSRVFNDSTDWLFGLYYLNLDEDNQIEEFFNGDVFRQLASDFNSKSTAAFFQLDTYLSEKNTLTTGLRYERRTADYSDNSGLNLSPSDSMWGGQLSLNHKINSQLNSYVTLAKGYKAGGFNLSLSVPDSLREFQPEYLMSLETGFKGFSEGYRWSWNVSAFYMKREDMQVSTSQQLDPEDPLTFVFFTGNAASGNNYGLEADFNFQYNQNWDFFGSLGLLETKFDEFVGANGQIEGRDQAHAPGYQFSLGAEYHHIDGFFARIDLNGKDEFYFSDSHNQLSNDYMLTNLKLGYEKTSWGVFLWANNVFDEEYATRGFFFGLEPPNYEDTLYVQKGNPRHVGMTFEYEF